MKGARPDRLRLAELTSGVGALVLGMGIGGLLSERLSGLALPFLIAGAAAHAWGMLDKHRLERQSGASDSWWSPAAYWLCWMLLGLLAVGIAGRLTSVL